MPHPRSSWTTRKQRKDHPSGAEHPAHTAWSGSRPPGDCIAQGDSQRIQTKPEPSLSLVKTVTGWWPGQLSPPDATLQVGLLHICLCPRIQKPREHRHSVSSTAEHPAPRASPDPGQALSKRLLNEWMAVLQHRKAAVEIHDKGQGNLPHNYSCSTTEPAASWSKTLLSVTETIKLDGGWPGRLPF